MIPHCFQDLVIQSDMFGFYSNVVTVQLPRAKWKLKPHAVLHVSESSKITHPDTSRIETSELRKKKNYINFVEMESKIFQLVMNKMVSRRMMLEPINSDKKILQILN